MLTSWAMRVASLFALPVAVAGPVASVSAQECEPGWRATDGGVAGVSGWVNALMAWDRDGTGPEPESVLVGGQIFVAGTAKVDAVVLYTPATRTFTNLGFPFLGEARAFAVHPDLGLLVGGAFFDPFRGESVSGVVRWDGSAWQQVGGAFHGWVHALAVMPDGAIVAGGLISLTGSDEDRQNIVRWDGSAWSALGGGASSWVRCLLTMPNGDLIAGGEFTRIGPTMAKGAAKWNGSEWSALGSEAIFARSLALLPTDEVLVAGSFEVREGGESWYSMLAKWDGSAWTVIRDDLGLLYRAGQVVSVLADGSVLVVDGGFSGGLPGTARLTRWDGQTWTPLVLAEDFWGIDHTISSIATLSDGRIVFGGDFTTANGMRASAVAIWDGRAVVPTTNGTVQGTFDLALSPDSGLLATGRFSVEGEARQTTLARWDGSSWRSVGAGTVEDARLVHAMSNGDVIVVGYFDRIGDEGGAGGVSARGIARWDGRAWSAMDAGIDADTVEIAVIAEDPAGRVLIGGAQRTADPWRTRMLVARWDGSTWTRIENPSGVEGWVFGIDFLPTGEAVIGGAFVDDAAGAVFGVMRWTGSAWVPLGDGAGLDVRSLRALPDGDLVASGAVLSNTLVWDTKRWNGSAWVPMGLSPGDQIENMQRLPDGTLVALSTLSRERMEEYRVVRWDGQAWTQLGESMITRGHTLEVTPAGDVFVAGGVAPVGDRVSFGLSLLRTCVIRGCSPADIATSDGRSRSVGGGGDGTIDTGDFSAFFVAFFAHADDVGRFDADIADTDGLTIRSNVTPDGQVDNGDFIAFFSFFFQGCATP